MSTTTITLGLTIHHDGVNYVPFFDTYRPGTPQVTIPITVPTTALADFDGDVERIADAVFHASNTAFDPELQSIPTSAAVAIIVNAFKSTIARIGQVRSMSVGDTVTVGDVTVSCDNAGWSVVTLNA